MIYFYTLIANGTTKSRIPKSFHKALEALEHINALEVKGERICLKPSLILGIIDVSKSGKYFLQSLHKAHSEDFSLQVPKHTFYAKGDIILAKNIGDTKGNASAIAAPAFCQLEPLDEELLSKTLKGTTSDSGRDSSPLAGVQNDNESQMSFSSETRSRLG